MSAQELATCLNLLQTIKNIKNILGEYFELSLIEQNDKIRIITSDETTNFGLEKTTIGYDDLENLFIALIEMRLGVEDIFLILSKSETLKKRFIKFIDNIY